MSSRPLLSSRSVRTLFATLALSALVLGALGLQSVAWGGPAEASALARAGMRRTAPTAPFAPGLLVVGFKAGASSRATRAMLERTGVAEPSTPASAVLDRRSTPGDHRFGRAREASPRTRCGVGRPRLHRAHRCHAEAVHPERPRALGQARRLAAAAVELRWPVRRERAASLGERGRRRPSRRVRSDRRRAGHGRGLCRPRTVRPLS